MVPDRNDGDVTAGFAAPLAGGSEDPIVARVAGETDDGSCDCALVVVKRGPNAGSRFVLHHPVTSAGRHPLSDIYLDDITVSRVHAEFRKENGRYRLVDTGSLNGTHVNHKPVKSVSLAPGDEIHIGKFLLVFLERTATP